MSLYSLSIYSPRIERHLQFYIQTADKGISTVKITKSFRPPFWGGGAIQGAEPWSPSAEGEISFWRFLFPNTSEAKFFSLRLFLQRKSGYGFVQIDVLSLFQRCLSAVWYTPFYYSLMFPARWFMNCWAVRQEIPPFRISHLWASEIISLSERVMEGYLFASLSTISSNSVFEGLK